MSPTHRPLAVLFGTRPEAIKLAPVVEAMRRSGLPHVVVVTGQHTDMVDEVLRLFDIEPAMNLGIMRSGQTLDAMLARTLEVVPPALAELQPSAIVVQGDTTSMLGATLSAFHAGIPVAHVEAGLRTDDMAHPFPEEMNRRLASAIASWHFAPTPRAAANLAREGITAGVHVVGNTVVDGLQRILATSPGLPPQLAERLSGHPYVLATAHRRESWTTGIGEIADALVAVLVARPELRIVFVTHPNPLARGPVEARLGSDPRSVVLDAVPYPTFVRLMQGARLIVSDSGGVQEEAATLGVPVLVTRSTTERPEGIEAGAARLVGTRMDDVRAAVLAVLDDPSDLARMASAGRQLYGDGHAAGRLVAVLSREIGD